MWTTELDSVGRAKCNRPTIIIPVPGAFTNFTESDVDAPIFCGGKNDVCTIN
jgi:hypothetical protein